MPVQVSKVPRDQMSLRPRSKALEVAVSAEDPSLGVVVVTLCEIPAGLFEELEGEIRDLMDEGSEKNRQIAAARRKSFELEDALYAGAWPDPSKAFEAGAIQAELAELADRVKILKDRRKEIRAEAARRKLELIAWGICDHRAADFLNGDEPVPFEPTGGSYDGMTYRIASGQTIGEYVSAGQSLIESLVLAVCNYQRQRVITPAQVWKAEAEAKALLEKAYQAAIAGQVDRVLGDAIGAPKNADEAAELGAELDDSSPNEKRPTTTTTTPAQ